MAHKAIKKIIYYFFMYIYLLKSFKKGEKIFQGPNVSVDQPPSSGE